MPGRSRSRHRRVQTPAVPGSDPEPQAAVVVRLDLAADRAAEDTDSGWGGGSAGNDANDERLKVDKPPHWG